MCKKIQQIFYNFFHWLLYFFINPATHPLGDAMVLLRAVGAAEYANSQNELAEFCNENNIRQKAVIEVRKIRLQLTNEINLLNRELDLIVNPQMTPPDVTQVFSGIKLVSFPVYLSQVVCNWCLTRLPYTSQYKKNNLMPNKK